MNKSATMTCFELIKEQLEAAGVSTPCAGENADGENVIVESGKDEEGRYFRLTTCQKNNWCRINTYYQNGNQTESYER